jgi:hypothetical protein
VNPIVPGNVRDRTGTAGILRRAVAEINRRFVGLERQVLDIFGGIRVLAANDASTVLGRSIYAMTPEEMAAVSRALRDALDRWIASGRDPANSAWWSTYDAEASHAGAAQSVMNLSRLSPAYAATTTLQTVLVSTAYRNRVGMAQIKSYDHWTGLSAGMHSELSQIIGRAVADGKAPRAVVTEIRERLGVNRAAARLYAQTDITDTLRQARWAEAERAQDELGLRLALLWTSALIPTTRQWHASRHGKVYTPAEVRTFYGQRGNRYRCHCGQTEALLDETGTPILTDTLKRAMAKERKAWERTQHDAP